MSCRHQWTDPTWSVSSVDPSDDAPAVLGENAGPCIRITRSCGVCDLIQREVERDVWEDWFDPHMPFTAGLEELLEADLAHRLAVVTQPMFRPDYGGAVLTQELVEESFEAARLADRIMTIDVYRADGRRYRIAPAGPLRRFWNWLRGYRRPRGS